MSTFLELLEYCDEFPFWYCGTRYEIVYGRDGKLLLYCGNPPGVLVAQYANTDDFLRNGSILGRTIKEVINYARIE